MRPSLKLCFLHREPHMRFACTASETKKPLPERLRSRRSGQRRCWGPLCGPLGVADDALAQTDAMTAPPTAQRLRRCRGIAAKANESLGFWIETAYVRRARKGAPFSVRMTRIWRRPLKKFALCLMNDILGAPLCAKAAPPISCPCVSSIGGDSNFSRAPASDLPAAPYWLRAAIECGRISGGKP